MIANKNTPTLSPVKPVHVTLTSATADSIGKAIQDGIYPHGSQMPSEKELMAMLGVSRTTLREALKTLEDLGMIVRKRGLGTFVGEKSIIKDLSSNFGISDMISQAGMVPGSLETEVRSEPASPTVAGNLGISEGMPLIVVDRVRTANGKPAVWSLDYFASELINEEILAEYTAQDSSLYQFLNDSYHISVTHGDAQLRPILANSQMASKLKIHRGSPLMQITQTDFSSLNHPILFSIEYHLPDLFVFLIHRKGPQW